MVIRRARPADYAAFEEIEKRHEGFPAWSVKGFSEEENNAHSVTLAADDGGKIIGFVNFWMLRPQVQLNLIAVRADSLRSKTGSMLFLKLLEYAKKSLCSEIVLEVNVNNAAALAFYRKFGFEVVGRRSKFYNNRDDALLMRAAV